MNEQVSKDELFQAFRRRDLGALARHLTGESATTQQDECYRVAPQARQLWGIPPSCSLEVIHLAGAPHRWSVLGLSSSEQATPPQEPAGHVHRDEALSLIRATWRHNPRHWALWLWFEPHTDQLCVAICRASGVDPSACEILCAEFDPVQLEASGVEPLLVLCRDASNGEDARAWRTRQVEMLRQETITRRFYADFLHARRRLADTLLDGPTSRTEREAFALTWLLRVLVLYFLQWRGALARDRWFLHRRLRAQTSGQLAKSFFLSTLKPLCFGALSLPVSARRGEDLLALGEIPFLNGGLFERTPLEERHADFSWPAGVWEEVLEGCFERYSFVLREPAHGVQSTSIDPEMLGRVFESLMCQQERSKTGAFYTPQWLVQKIVASTLSGWMASTAQITPHEALALFSPAAADALSLREDERARCASALHTLRILDPAVGTGAFLIEALCALRRAWLRLGDVAGPDVRSWAGVRTLIHENLHGVDLNSEAVRLCELRLWFAMLSTWPEDISGCLDAIEPLPNLGHRVMVGDSLIGPTEELLMMRQQHGTSGKKKVTVKLSNEAFALCERMATRRREESGFARRIDTLQQVYLTAHGEEKRQAMRAIEEEERAQAIATWAQERARCSESIEEIEHLRAAPDLFGQTGHALSKDLERELLMLYREREALSSTIDDLASHRRAPRFCYDTRFARVMQQEGGFDVILTNPPWVRATMQKGERKSLYKLRYESARNELWRGASEQGVVATFGTQVDLCALFIERSMELLKQGGRFGALIPAKIFRSLHGSAVRGVMARHRILSLEDMSCFEPEHTQRWFDAQVYPAVIELERASARSTPDAPTRITVWRGQTREVMAREVDRLCLHGNDLREPWLMANPAFGALQDRLAHGIERGQLCLLGEREPLRPRRGVMTGGNAIFMPGRDALLAMCGHDLNLYRTWTRGVIRGRGVTSWKITSRTDDRMLWPYLDGELVELAALPPKMSAYLEEQEAALRARSDLGSSADDFWRLFRVQEGMEQAKVVWSDLSCWMEAACVESDSVPLNTTYYIACQDPLRAWLLTAWLNARVTRHFLRQLAERANQDYRRHFGWVVASMKLPVRWADWLCGAPDPEIEAHCMHWRAHAQGALLAERHLHDVMLGDGAAAIIEGCDAIASVHASRRVVA